MKRFWLGLAVLSILALCSSAALAQPPGGKGGPGKGGPGKGGFGKGGFGKGFASPMMKALDVDGDGALSADEIKNAAKALLTLDKDGDGKLTAEELRPAFGGKKPGAKGGSGEKKGKPPEKKNDASVIPGQVRSVDRVVTSRIAREEVLFFVQRQN